jgi:ribose transport system substrate-binding protein
VDLIVLNGAPNPAQLQPQLEQAKKAGIPVLATHMDQPWPACEENPELKNERFGELGVCFGAGAIDPKVHENLTGLVAGPLAPQAYVEAHYAIAQTKAKLNALIIQSSDIYDSQGIVDILQGEFKKLCPDTCKSTVVDVPVSEWASKLQSEAQTALQRDPTINFVIPLFDSMTQFLSPALKVAGRTDVGVVSFNGTPFVLKKVQDGEVTAVLGENLDWIAHASMDQAMRILTGTEQVKDALIPLRVFDKSNASEAGTPPAFDTGYGDAYKAGYRELWKK